MTSATDELRRLLDERDEYYKTSGNKTWWGRPIDMQTGKPINVFHYQAQPMGEDRLFVELQLATPEQAIAATLGPNVTGNTSDGYHTFNELYHHRAVLFSVIVRDHRELAWKSMRHHDGTMYDGMFIVGIETPEGQATYHYDIDPYWDMFNCKELDQAPEWDGHTPSEAIERIATLGSCNCPNDCTNGERTGTCEMEYVSDWMSWHCKSCDHMDMAPRNPKSITDELREYFGKSKGMFTDHVLSIADRIDAEHERKCKEQYACGAEHGIGASIEASMIQTHGYIELPKDADGEYIHIGDVMEERSGHTFEVASLMAFGGSDNWLVLSDPRNFSSFREPHDIRHHHKPTVEDVMVEFATDWESAPDGEDKTAVLKKYAAKLRLVNDEE